jgi:hypothetical protein
MSYFGFGPLPDDDATTPPSSSNIGSTGMPDGAKPSASFSSSRLGPGDPARASVEVEEVIAKEAWLRSIDSGPSGIYKGKSRAIIIDKPAAIEVGIGKPMELPLSSATAS